MAPTVSGGYSLLVDSGIYTDTVSVTAASCVGNSTSGYDFFHNINVPAGTTLRVESLSLRGSSHGLYFINNCANPQSSCLAGKYITSGTQAYQDTLEWANTATTDQVITVVVDGAFSNAAGLFAITFDIITP